MDGSYAPQWSLEFNTHPSHPWLELSIPYVLDNPCTSTAAATTTTTTVVGGGGDGLGIDNGP